MDNYKKVMEVYIKGLDLDIKHSEKFIKEMKKDVIRCEKEIEILNLRIANNEESQSITKERKKEAIKQLDEHGKAK